MDVKLLKNFSVLFFPEFNIRYSSVFSFFVTRDALAP